MPTATARIDHSALLNNMRRVRERAPDAAIIAMVKANAYGHGLLRVAGTLAQSVDAFGVSHTEEALTLRHAGFNQRVIVMAGFHDSAELQLLSEYHVDAVIHQPYHLDILQQQMLVEPLQTWLKIDTGMHRIGFAPRAAREAFRHLLLNQQIIKPIGLLTHFSDADALDKQKTDEQFALFESITEEMPGFKSVANSAAILRHSDFHLDWIRPGIMLYGISPFVDRVGTDFGLIPVMTLASHLIAIHELPCGAEIGYGSTYRAPQDIRVGVVAIGYGDGYPRHAKTGTPVLIHNKRCELLGRVSMDMITVDISHVPEAHIGSEVILWGDGLPAEEVARHADTIAYHLVTGITSRVSSIFSQSETIDTLKERHDLQLS